MKKFISLILLFIIMFSIIGCVKPEKGEKGDQGEQGLTGNGVSLITLTESKDLVDTYTIYYTDGSTTTFTVTNGKDGAQGIQGIQGEPGKDGHTPVITIENGNWYIDGVDTGKSAIGLKGDTGNGISSITLTKQDGLVDTYTITFTDGTTTTFTVTNGKDGAQGIQGIQGEPGKDGHTPVITIENGNWYIDGVNIKVSATGPKGETGNGISSIEKTSTNGVVDTYTITFTDGTTTTFTVTNGNDGVDGKTPYIGGNGNWWIGQEDTGVKAEIQEDKYLIPNTLDKNYFEGKTIVCIGDSITAGVGTTVGVNDYVTLLGEKLGANTIRKGVSGTVLCTDGQRKCNIDMLTKENINGADIVTIFMGINDWANATKNFYSLRTLGSDDTSTIYGAVDMWCR